MPAIVWPGAIDMPAIVWPGAIDMPAIVWPGAIDIVAAAGDAEPELLLEAQPVNPAATAIRTTASKPRADCRFIMGCSDSPACRTA